ncbi:hypothetical protein R9C00_03895 [Flammeovirgaceae bacterium SG7u.111]|nr:hypothetical protein [Flammeovirgaceae bacterium SG7u.132]WPO36588.1 hypothetical protein R9C00_03895 [Flammeovirgaceae bacterium SG7u.111]
MIQNYLYSRLIVVLLATSPLLSFAQATKDKKETQQGLVQNIIVQYPQAAENIHYGETDVFSPRRTDGHQYLIDNDFKKCIVYTLKNKINCDNCRYDIMEDRLNMFVDEPFVASMVSLTTSNIKAFELEGRTFVKFANTQYDSSAVTHHIKEGFYEQVYKGTISCYVSWKKEFLESKSNTENSSFKESHKIYAHVAGDPEFKRINSKGSIMKLMPEKKKEIKAILKLHHFSPRHSSPAALNQIFTDINLLP